jgi:sporulation protein YlmC with PRC-barrel domain
MRLSDLLDSDVVDAEGRTLGHVHDVRLVQEGPTVGSSKATFRVAGLVVGGTKVGARLGFGRPKVRGPWLLKRLFERLHADDRFVPWGSVRAVTQGAIHVDVSAADLRRPEPLP